jgi:hypothetical protein
MTKIYHEEHKGYEGHGEFGYLIMEHPITTVNSA